MDFKDLIDFVDKHRDEIPHDSEIQGLLEIRAPKEDFDVNIDSIDMSVSSGKKFCTIDCWLEEKS